MRQTNRLKASEIASAPPGRHSDGGGLALQVERSGSRSWVARLSIDGTQRAVGLGGFPAVSLGEARRKVARMRADIAEGADPRQQARSTVPTFAEAAARLHAQKAPGFRSPKAAREWLRRLERHALPRLGALAVDEIGKADVLDVLDPIWAVHNHTAKKVRDGMRQVFAWAAARDLIEHNPAGEVIDGALSRQAPGGNVRALGWRDVPAAYQAIEASGAGDAMRLALCWQVLTAARPGEATGTRWAEIDIDAAVWAVPGERMKAGRPHTVPLSAAALGVLDAARCLDDGSGLVFPSPAKPGQRLHDGSVNRLLDRLGIDCAPHGFRSSFRTWAAECTEAPWAVAEAALAHRIGDGVESRYLRSDLLDPRRALMAAWGRYVTGQR